MNYRNAVRGAITVRMVNRWADKIESICLSFIALNRINVVTSIRGRVGHTSVAVFPAQEMIRHVHLAEDFRRVP
jgi:hypothetical protein